MRKATSAKKAKTPPINFIINLQVYPFDLMVSIGESDVELGKKLDIYRGLTEGEINDCRYTSDNCQGIYVPLSNGAYVIRLREIPKTPEGMGTLAHEVCHVVVALMETIGMELKDNISAEAYCYLIGFITKSIYKQISKYY